MGKIDRIKEQIGALKIYLAIVVSLMVTIGAGVAKLFLDNKSSFLMWLGIIGIILLSLVFVLIAKHMHRKIDELEEL